MAEDKVKYAFTAESSLIAELKLLAKDYKVSMNTALILMVEEALESWSLPTLEPHHRPMEVDEDREGQKAST